MGLRPVRQRIVDGGEEFERDGERIPLEVGGTYTANDVDGVRGTAAPGRPRQWRAPRLLELAATRGYGAEVLLYDRYTEDREAIGQGLAHERGVGNVVNATLSPGTDGEAFRHAWREHLLPQVDAFRPQLVLVSAGFDGHRLDPLADLMLETEDFGWVTRQLRTLAQRHAGGRVVSMLEGGYDLDALRDSVAAHVDELR